MRVQNNGTDVAVQPILNFTTPSSISVDNANARINIATSSSSSGGGLDAQYFEVRTYSGSTYNSNGFNILSINTYSEPATSTGFRTNKRFKRATGATAANATAGWTTNSDALFIASEVSWKYRLIFGMNDALTDKRVLVGFKPTFSAVATVDASTLLNIIAIAADTADTNLQFMRNDGSGTATKVDLGVAKTNTSSWFSLALDYDRASAVLTVLIKQQTAVASFTTLLSTTYNTDLPGVVGIGPCFETRTVASGTAIIDWKYAWGEYWD